MYHYNMRVVHVIDGDTVEAEIDLGFDIWYRTPIRLARINAPELKGATREAGLAAGDYLEGLLAKGPLTVKTELRRERDKYGRVLGTIYAGEVDVCGDMVRAGHAVWYMNT